MRNPLLKEMFVAPVCLHCTKVQLPPHIYVHVHTQYMYMQEHYIHRHLKRGE